MGRSLYGAIGSRETGGFISQPLRVAKHAGVVVVARTEAGGSTPGNSIGRESALFGGKGLVGTTVGYADLPDLQAATFNSRHGTDGDDGTELGAGRPGDPDGPLPFDHDSDAILVEA